MDRRVCEIVELLEDDWRRPHRVEDLAASVNLGASRLAHLVRHELNTCIRDMIRRRRLTEAALLLRTTNRRISEISYLVGFADVSNFNHAFRRELGVSPKTYRHEVSDSSSRNLHISNPFDFSG
jgi:AraC-like DNA-binding protein